MKHSVKIVLILLVALAAGAAGVYSARRGETAATTATAAQQAALERLLNLELPDNGGTQRPLAAWKGKVLVINYWATWCPPCLKEMPAFTAANLKYQPQGVQFIGLSVDTETNVREFQAKHQINYPLLIAPPSAVRLTEELGNTAQVLPFTVIVDQKGGIALIKRGALSEAELDAKLAELTRPG